MAGSYAVTVSAVDNFSKTIDAFNKRMQGITAPVDRLNKSLSFGDVTGIRSLTTGVTRASSQMLDFARSTASVIAPLGVITSAASIGGLAKLAESFGNFGSNLGFTAANIGISVPKLHALEGAARLAGSSASSLDSGMLNLSQTITDAIGGRNQDAAGYFRKLGIQITDASGKARPAADVFPEVADALVRIGDPALTRRVAAAFGQSDDLLPLLRKGSAGLREYEAEARKYGIVNEVGARAANEMRESMTRLTLSTEGLGYSIAERLSPVISPMLTGLADWVAAHRTDISTGVEKIALSFEHWAENGGMAGISSGLQDVGGDLKWVSDKLGLADISTQAWTKGLTTLGGVLLLRATGVASLAASIAKFSAITLPSWLAALIGGPATATFYGLSLAGIAAGHMGAPMVDDYGNVIGNWGGDEGQKKWDDQARNSVHAGDGSGVGRWWRGHAPTWLGGETAPLPSGQRGANLRESYNFWRSKGFTAQGAAAMVAEEDSESGGDPGNVGDGGAARGSFQWHPDRAAAIRYRTGIDVTDPNTTHLQQLQAMHAELSQGIDAQAGAAYQRIKNAATIEDAVRAAVRDVERPGDTLGRFMTDQQKASRFAAEYGSMGPPGPYTPAALPAPGSGVAGAPGPSGAVKIEIIHTNPPAGSALKVTTTGNVRAGARIESNSLLTPN